MFLHEDEAAFSDATLKTSRKLGMNPSFVSKDYFVCAFLREMTKRYPPIVFKGGTALSKCHHAINRFSEDVDLGIELEHISQSERKKIKNAVVDSCNALGLPITNLDETRSGRDYNKYEIELPFGSKSHLLKSHLIVETALMTPVSPFVRMNVAPFIYEVLHESASANALFSAFELGPFNVRSTSLERSFVDKTFAICDYYLSEDEPDRCSRHIYDLHKLIDRISLDESMADLFEKVRAQRNGRPKCLSAQNGINIAVILREIVKTDYFKSDYSQTTRYLLLERVPYTTAVASLEKIAEFIDRQQARAT